MIKLKFKEPVNEKDICLKIPKECEEKFLKDIGPNPNKEGIDIIFSEMDQEIFDTFVDWYKIIRNSAPGYMKHRWVDCIVEIDGKDIYKLTSVIPWRFGSVNPTRLSLDWNYRFTFGENGKIKI